MLAALQCEPRALRSASDAAWRALRRALSSSSSPATSEGKAPRSQTPGARGIKTADGNPAPDPRTIAHLVESGLFGSPEAAAAALGGSSHRRYPYDTARPVIEWLKETFSVRSSAISRNGLAGAARIIARRPLVLSCLLPPMRARWDALLAPRAAGGLGLPLAKALKRVEGYPNLLTLPTDRLLARVQLIESLGSADATATLAKAPSLTGLSAELLTANAAWLKAQGIDLPFAFVQAPALFYLSRDNLAPKLDFLRRVVHLSPEDINFDPTVLGRSLAGRLRPRFFFAYHFGAHDLMRFTSLVIKPDAHALQFVRDRALLRVDEAHAADWSLPWYQGLMASDAFRAWAAETEAARRAQWQRMHA